MRTSHGMIFLAFILMLVTSFSFSQTQFTIDELPGIKWFNKDYPPSSGSDSLEITTDGMLKFYGSLFPNEQPYIGEFTITESWYDDEGDLWFKNTWGNKDLGGIEYFLNKISKSGTVWEGCWNGTSYPTEISPIEGECFVYYRLRGR